MNFLTGHCVSLKDVRGLGWRWVRGHLKVGCTPIWASPLKNTHLESIYRMERRTLNWLPRRPSTLAQPQLLWRPWTIIIIAHINWVLTMHRYCVLSTLHTWPYNWIWIPKWMVEASHDAAPFFSPLHAPLSEVITPYFKLLLFPSLPCTISSTWIAFSNSVYQNSGHPSRLACMLTVPWNFSLGRLSLMNTSETLYLIQ